MQQSKGVINTTLQEIYTANNINLAKVKFDNVYSTEAKVTEEVKKYLNQLKPHLTYWKASDRFHPGVSDIIICFNGKFGAIELKDDTGQPTFKQTEFLINITLAGGFGGICRTVRDVEKLLQKMC